MTQELLKSYEEFDRLEEEYLSQIFANDEETERVQALAAERSAKTFENCKTKEEFEAIVGEAL